VASRRTLERLLDRRNEHPEQLTEIDGTIRQQFERELAILVLDMCGFSRLTMKHGIVHYLAMIRRMQRVALPRIAAARGTLLKTEADNVFASFRDVPEALAAAESIQAELALQNRGLPEDWDVHVSIGIGHGPLLLVGDHDAFGGEMNLASKLGEDLAQAGDVFLTERAYARLCAKERAMTRAFVRRAAAVSGMRLKYYAPRKRPTAQSARKRPASKR
jgi:adenylate cyclase